MKFLFTIVLIVIMIPLCYSQADYRSGYIIKNSNDTLFGQIDYRNDTWSARKCAFRLSPENETVIYLPGQIKAYRFTNSKYFVSKKVAVAGKKEEVFLEYLVEGVINIYSFRDEIGDHYFIQNNNDTIVPLDNTERTYYKNNTKYVTGGSEYKGVLNYYFHESPSATKDIINLSLDRSSLVKIAQDYHSEICPDRRCITYEKNIHHLKSRFGPIIALNYLKISAKSGFTDEFYYLDKSNFKTIIYPSVGVFGKFNMPNINERLWLQLNIMLGRWTARTENLYFEPVYSLNYYNNIKFTLTTLQNDLLLSYEYPSGEIRPFVEAGGFFSLLFAGDFSRELDVQWSSGKTYYTHHTDQYPFHENDFGPSAGIGCIIKLSKNTELSEDIKYSRGYGIIRHLHTNNLGLNVGLYF